MQSHRRGWNEVADSGDRPWGRSTLRASDILIRPARSSDAAGVQAFVRGLSTETRRKRFFAPISELSPSQLDRLTSSTTAHDLSLLVLHRSRGIIGMAQCAATGSTEAEFAVVVADEWQRQGVGTTLLSLLLDHARDCGLASLNGFVLADNWAMLGLASKLGFSLVDDPDPALVRVHAAPAATRSSTVDGYSCFAMEAG